ncbi:TPA: hypothetical protein ACRNK3_004284 [Pseudomonas aeruginosa]
MSNEDWNELDESYRSALSGALETAHPAVEQAGGDERAKFEYWASDEGIYPKAIERSGNCYKLAQTQSYWMAWQARAALAQPSPAQADEKPGDSILCYGCFAKGVGPDHFDEAGKCLAAQAEAERPEVVARVVHSNPVVLGQCGPLNANDELMTVAQHAASVARWAEMFNRVEQQRDAALARVAELERQEPVVRAYGVLPPFAEKVLAKLRRFYDCAEDFESGGVDIGRHWLDLLTQLGLLNRVQRSPALWEISQQGKDLLEAPVAQAQQLNDLDKQCRDDVARALGLRPNQERGFAWSYLLASIKSCVKASGDSAQAQHSVPGDIMRDAQRYRWLRDQQFYFSFSTENSDAGISSCTAGMSSRFKNLSWVDAAIDSAIAAAPGKEVGHE